MGGMLNYTNFKLALAKGIMPRMPCISAPIPLYCSFIRVLSAQQGVYLSHLGENETPLPLSCIVVLLEHLGIGYQDKEELTHRES